MASSLMLNVKGFALMDHWHRISCCSFPRASAIKTKCAKCLRKVWGYLWILASWVLCIFFCMWIFILWLFFFLQCTFLNQISFQGITLYKHTVIYWRFTVQGKKQMNLTASRHFNPLKCPMTWVPLPGYKWGKQGLKGLRTCRGPLTSEQQGWMMTEICRFLDQDESEPP